MKISACADSAEECVLTRSVVPSYACLLTCVGTDLSNYSLSV